MSDFQSRLQRALQSADISTQRNAIRSVIPIVRSYVEGIAEDKQTISEIRLKENELRRLERDDDEGEKKSEIQELRREIEAGRELERVLRKKRDFIKDFKQDITELDRLVRKI